ncbi:hypothetical protein [Longimicrobium sp.]|jgi:hypothetical protein|uniref:hypothetical protein n=1 Tax=Longimicrobium sp. TaxID=2029185 RepID=UPI002F94ED05
MRLLRILLGLAAVGVVVAAFRDSRRQRWLRPATSGFEGDDDDRLPTALETEEPVLGYDGMDRDTLVDWLSEAELDRATLLRIHAYESANMARGSVLDTVDDLLG